MKAPSEVALGPAVRRPLDTIRRLRDHLQAAPEDAAAWEDVAEAMLDIGQGQHAVPAARRAWVLQRNTDSATLMAVALAQAGRAPDAIKLVQAAIAKRPSSSLAWERIARALATIGAHDSALDASWQAYTRNPGDADLAARTADRLERGGRRLDARRVVDGVLRRSPSHALARHVAARLAFHAGELDRAAEQARALLLDGTADHPAELWKDLARIENARERPRDAFMAAEVGNAQALFDWAVAREGRPGALLHELDQTVARVRAQGLAGPAGPSEDVEDLAEPVLFLVGFPDPSLDDVRRRLAAHPSIVTVRDPVLEIAAHRVLPGQDGARVLACAEDPEIAEQLRTAWREEVRIRVDPEGRRVVDAGPANLLRVELIARLFPRAAVMSVVRDPRDAVVAGYLADFDGAEALAPLADLPSSATLCAGLHALWDLAAPYLEAPGRIRFEQAQASPRATFEPVLERLGLGWDDAMYDAAADPDVSSVGETPRAALRPPRQPPTIGRWRAYQDHLQGVLDVLAPAVQALGYDGEMR